MAVGAQMRFDIGGLDGAVGGRLGLGEVFTRPWVVRLILDLAGYTPDRDLASLRAVEPACGQGAFLGEIIERLVESARLHGLDSAQLLGALRAYDLAPGNVELAKKLAVGLLADDGMGLPDAETLAETWISCDDFLLRPNEDVGFDFVVGNPPYIRLENVPAERSEAYRRACATMRGRSDVYVGFIERGLRLLAPGGTLAFIVADRWMHNQYGTQLRRLVGSGYSVDTVVEMHEVNAFDDEVSSYPAICIIRRQPQGSAVLARAGRSFGAADAERLRTWASQGRTDVAVHRSFDGVRLPSWFSGDELWPSGDPRALALIRDLERRHPPLQDQSTGTRVGIGVATGADSVYLTSQPDLVEDDRLLPVVLARDIGSGTIAWSGTRLINPWKDGKLVALGDYPRLRRYLEEHEGVVRERHVARNNKSAWYRTIDRVEPRLLERPKILLPELKASIHPVLEGGMFYPHHNLYFVTSESWDLEVLGGLLLSDIANLFVGAYCVKMRGGCYRFQAQYLRKIRIPALGSLTTRHKRTLARAFEQRDVAAATDIAGRLYGVTIPLLSRTPGPSDAR